MNIKIEYVNPEELIPYDNNPRRNDEVEEKEIILDKTGREVKRIKVTKKHIPPDLNAAKYIQEMRRTGEW